MTQQNANIYNKNTGRASMRYAELSAISGAAASKVPFLSPVPVAASAASYFVGYSTFVEAGDHKVVYSSIDASTGGYHILTTGVW